MALALRVREVVRLVVVHRHAERAVNSAVVVPPQVRVFRQVDCFERLCDESVC